MPRIWRTISRSGRKRVQVRSERPLRVPPAKGDDWSDVLGFIGGAILTVVTLCLIWEYLAVILLCGAIVAFVAMCSK